MFFLKSKLDLNLRYALENNLYKTYRVNLHCKNLLENIEKKIISYNGKLIRSIPNIGIICSELSSKAIERLIEYPEVDYITMDSFAHLCGTSVLSSNGIKHQEHRYKLTGKGIGIGIIDSGTYPHPDLITPISRIKSFLDLIDNRKFPYDDNGHGTFISGIISGNGNLSKGMYRGVAENSSLHIIKAFNALGKGYVSDILYGIDYFIDNSEKLNIKVLCLPFELLYNDKFILDAFCRLFKQATMKGIIPIVPSGSNINSEGSIIGIATLPYCITIGGLDTRNSPIAYKFSSSGPCGKVEKPDFSAACVDICSLNSNTSYVSERNGVKLFDKPLDKPYTTYTGTSCAAAFMSGICALLLQNNPELAFKDIVSLIKVSCKLLNISRWQQGNGVIDINILLP
jgi:subtilisin family serine protease